jgi:dihydroorotase
MTKLLALGLSLQEVITACTSRPATAIRWEDRLGSIAVGREADLAILEVRNEPIVLTDSVGAEMSAERQIVTRWTIRGGTPMVAGGSAGGL